VQHLGQDQGDLLPYLGRSQVQLQLANPRLQINDPGVRRPAGLGRPAYRPRLQPGQRRLQHGVAQRAEAALAQTQLETGLAHRLLPG
jgi:hypothetical protein